MFSANRKQATLRTASQIPSAALAPEQLSQYVPEGEQPPAYIDEDVENIKDYYKIGG